LLAILKSYFRHAEKYHPKPDDAGETTYFSQVGVDFLVRSAKALQGLQPTSPLFSQHENLLKSLATSLQVLHDDLAVHPPPDYLFFASLLYIRWPLFYGWDKEIIKTDAGRDLILAILRYHARVTRLRTDIAEGFYNTHGFTFERDWPYFVEHAKELGVVLPPPAVQLLTDPLPLEDAQVQEERCSPSGDAVLEVQVDPLGKRALRDNASAHSWLTMDRDGATA